MIRALILLCLAGLAVSSSAVADERKPLFREHSALKAVLTAPLSQTYAQRNSDVRLYFPGQWSYIDQSGETLRLDVSIRIRGNFRRSYCELPPIRLNFKKSQVEGTLFSGQDKLKLVAPCQHGLKAQQALLLEFMAYRIYEILTDQSFGTRLLRLSYVDADEKLKSWTDLVFVIEDEGDMGKRLGLDKANVAENRFEDLDHGSTALAELFQLMISNHDYSVLRGPKGEYCCHNVEIFTSEEAADRRIPIPFDFDMSGLVNAEYASPPSHLPIRLVRTRFYRGLCQPPEVMEDAIAHILSKKQEILDLFRNQPELSRNSRNRNLRYLGEYFAMLEDPVERQEKVLERCRGRERLEEMMDGEGERMGVPGPAGERARGAT
ncbi:MAG TPA: hypothetical protein VLA11_03060 [Woeseiaceae bacterium]|nr:hypothetical protein [Woeseiaceae bacterium]